jgi:DNA invertase Pin-like site-specific DNA recombinase
MKFVACYIRVSAVEKNQAEQRREINRWLKSNRISPKSVRWYIDKPPARRRRPKYEALQADILDGKVRAVVVWRLDRLSEKKTRDGLNVLIDWCDKSLRVVSVSQQIDVKSTDCRMIASVLRGVAEVGQELRRERTKVGLASARARGRAGGRPKIAADEPMVLKAKKLQKDGKLSIAEICKKLKISRSTYYRYVEM